MLTQCLYTSITLRILSINNNYNTKAHKEKYYTQGTHEWWVNEIDSINRSMDLTPTDRYDRLLNNAGFRGAVENPSKTFDSPKT